jgi:hypothetical protein
MRLSLALVLLLAATAHAGPDGSQYWDDGRVKALLAEAMAKQRARLCKPTGGTLLAIDHAAVHDDETIPLWSVVIYGTGAWQRTTWTTEGPLVLGDCLDSRAMDFVWDQLIAMKWRSRPARCDLVQPTHTIYRTRGKRRFIARACGPELDGDTSERLVAIDALLRTSLRRLFESLTKEPRKNSP